jgi:hypothetical protein
LSSTIHRCVKRHRTKNVTDGRETRSEGNCPKSPTTS